MQSWRSKEKWPLNITVLFSGKKENTKAGRRTVKNSTLNWILQKLSCFVALSWTIHYDSLSRRRTVCCLPPFFHWRLTCPPLQLLSRFFTEPCEDVPSYEFSCPRWQAQGYCEKRQKEMQVVCRKTCGFCGEWAGVLRKKALVFGLSSTRRLRDGRLVNYRSASPWNECTLVDVLVLFF